MNTINQIQQKSNQFKYLMLKIINNKHVVILTDVTGNEFGKGCGLSTIEAINNYYENNNQS